MNSVNFNTDATKRRTRTVHAGRCQGIADERKLLKTAQNKG